MSDLTLACLSPIDVDTLSHQICQPHRVATISPLQALGRAVRAVASIDTKRKYSRTARFLSKCICRPRASVRWLTDLYQSGMGDLVHLHPRLLLKPYRPYINRQNTFHLRAHTIRSHYQMAIRLISPRFVVQMLVGETLQLAKIQGKTADAAFELVLTRTDMFDREGELVLTLRTADTHLIVYRLVFSLGTSAAGKQALVVGCLQGPKHEGARDTVKHATKALHGIRPRNLLVDALYSIKRACGIQEIQCVSTAARVFQGESVHADYDAVWTEAGGVLQQDGMFRLPANLIHDISHVPSKHRAEYRRRMTLRDTLDRDIAAQLRSWQTSR
ncbi:VirK/YbjX family protein [Burkholderiaceae bacterium DAT-1]|nr:VirK/YbjX family protein [Burkholderiaceae bacterium DAT-1]